MAGEIRKRLTELNRAFDPNKMAKEAYDHFKKVTPYRTGNARRNTKLQGDEIQAQYPYAARLDQGYSPQAPQGMTRPTEQFIQEYIKKQARP